MIFGLKPQGYSINGWCRMQYLAPRYRAHFEHQDHVSRLGKRPSMGARMSSPPFIKFYPSDFLGGTSGLSPAERGVYITLLCLIFEADGPIPHDHGRLARRCGMPKAAFLRVIDELMNQGKIVETGGFLMNDRAEKALMDRQNRTQIATHAAQSRWSAPDQKGKEKQRDDNAGAMQGQCSGDANQKPELDIEDTSVSSITRPKPKPRKHRISEDAQITEGMVRAANKRGHALQEAQAQFERFKNYALANAKTFANWDRAFVTWLDSPYFKPITTGGQTNGRNADGAAADRARRAGERWATRVLDSGQGGNVAIPLFPTGSASGGSGGSD